MGRRAPSLTLITGPTTEPRTATEAKLEARIDGSAEDALITELIAAAREHCENYTGRQLYLATWRATFDTFPTRIELPKVPLISVSSIKYIDSAGVQQTLAASGYQVMQSKFGKVVPAYGEVWPHTRAQPDAVEVEYKAGHVDTSTSPDTGAVPGPLVRGMMLYLNHWYEHRSEVVIGTIAKPMPRASADAWASYVDPRGLI